MLRPPVLTRGHVGRIAVLGLIWGTSFLFIKVALEGISPSQVVLGRLVFGALVLVGIVAVRRVPLPRDPVVWAHAAVMSVVANIVPFFCFAWGEQRVTSGTAGVFNATTPLFTLLFAMVILPAERPTRARVLGLVVGFVGVVLTIGPWRESGGENLPSGQLACLLAGACYGVAFTYTRRFLSQRGIAPLALSTMQISMSALAMLVATPFVARQTMELTTPIVLAVLSLGALGTGVAYLLYYRLIQDVGAMTASLTIYIVPVVAVALGVVILRERVTWNLFAGAAVVFVGVAVAEGRLRLRRPTTGRPAAGDAATRAARTGRPDQVRS